MRKRFQKGWLSPISQSEEYTRPSMRNSAAWTFQRHSEL